MYGLLFFKVCLGCAAYRAFPIIRHIFPLGAGGYAIIRITLFWIVNIPADLTYVLVHRNPPFEMGSSYSLQRCYIEIGDLFCPSGYPISSIPFMGQIQVNSFIRPLTLFSISSRTSRIKSGGFPAGSGRFQSRI